MKDELRRENYGFANWMGSSYRPPTDLASHRIATYFIAAYGYFVFVSTDSGWWVVLEKSNNRQNSMEWGQRKRWVISTNLFFLIFSADQQHFIVHPESWRNHFLIMPWPGEFGKCVGNRLMIWISMLPRECGKHPESWTNNNYSPFHDEPLAII